mgnify:CR=1 FL=1
MFVHELWKNADPSRLALDGNRALTYAQLSDQVRMVRNVLYKKGIRRKDRVALYSANSVEFVVVYMAVVSLGAIIIPVNSSLVDREVDFILRDSETKLLVTDTSSGRGASDFCGCLDGGSGSGCGGRSTGISF